MCNRRATDYRRTTFSGRSDWRAQSSVGDLDGARQVSVASQCGCLVSAYTKAQKRTVQMPHTVAMILIMVMIMPVLGF